MTELSLVRVRPAGAACRKLSGALTTPVVYFYSGFKVRVGLERSLDGPFNSSQMSARVSS